LVKHDKVCDKNSSEIMPVPVLSHGSEIGVVKNDTTHIQSAEMKFLRSLKGN
jgi:hypothetical protein